MRPLEEELLLPKPNLYSKAGTVIGAAMAGPVKFSQLICGAFAAFVGASLLFGDDEQTRKAIKGVALTLATFATIMCVDTIIKTPALHARSNPTGFFQAMSSAMSDTTATLKAQFLGPRPSFDAN